MGWLVWIHCGLSVATLFPRVAESRPSPPLRRCTVKLAIPRPPAPPLPIVQSQVRIPDFIVDLDSSRLSRGQALTILVRPGDPVAFDGHEAWSGNVRVLLKGPDDGVAFECASLPIGAGEMKVTLFDRIDGTRRRHLFEKSGTYTVGIETFISGSTWAKTMKKQVMVSVEEPLKPEGQLVD